MLEQAGTAEPAVSTGTDISLAPSDITAEITKPDTDTTPAEYPKYGNEALDSIVGILSDKGVPVDKANSVFKEAVDTMDITKLDKSKLTELVGDGNATLIMSALSAEYAKVADKKAEAISTAVKVMGGEDNWERVKTHLNTEEGKVLVSKYSNLINAGGESLEYAMTKIRAEYEALDGTSLPMDMAGDAGKAPAGKAIDNNIDYVKELRTARAIQDKTQRDRAIKSVQTRRALARKN